MKVEIEVTEAMIRNSLDRANYNTAQMLDAAVRVAFEKALAEMDLVPVARQHIERAVTRMSDELVQKRLHRIVRGVINREIEVLVATTSASVGPSESAE